MDGPFGKSVHKAVKIKLEQNDIESLKVAVEPASFQDSLQMNRTLFEMMCGLMSGEANMILKGTFDKFDVCGFGALYPHIKGTC